MLYRVAYDGAENKISFEDLTGTLNKTLGDDLRTEYEYKMRADTPGEHFAIAGLDTGVAIIGGVTIGLFAVLIIALSVTRRKNRADE